MAVKKTRTRFSNVYAVRRKYERNYEVGIGVVGVGNKKKLRENEHDRFTNFYGTRVFVPARPVYKIAFEAVLNDKEKTAKRVKKFLKDKDKYTFYDSIGKDVVREMKRIIRAKNILKENSPATIKLKGKNYPLRNTGELYNNLAYRVYEYIKQ